MAKLPKIVVAVTGASGAIYAKALLDTLVAIKDQYAEVSVVMSANAKRIWSDELQQEDGYQKYPFSFYEKMNFNAPFASGSGGYDIMIVVPCSMGTLGRIANGISDDLITRAADVMLKEHRRLILCPRETPYSLIHVKNMESILLAGGLICPATPSFYSHPKDFLALARTVTNRLLELAGLHVDQYRWGA